LLLAPPALPPPQVADNAILVQSTTSTKNAGLYDYILPMVKADTGITVNVVAVGTGAANQECDEL
jgi:tungstate transport system substrate-binding protein